MGHTRQQNSNQFLTHEKTKVKIDGMKALRRLELTFSIAKSEQRQHFHRDDKENRGKEEHITSWISKYKV